MSRIIMLVPLNENVSMTTITLSLISLIDKKTTNIFFKYFFYFSLIDPLKDKTKFIINKYFSKNIITLENIDFSEQYFNSSQYNTLVNQVIEQCYNKKNINGLIFIKGINKKDHIDADKINYEVSQNINAEVIFLENLREYAFEYISKKENKIKIFLKYSKYKNILGFIFNNISSPFIKSKYNFTEKLNILYNLKKNAHIDIIKKDIFLKNRFFSTLACIPWNKSLLKPSVIEICSFLNASIINTKNIKNSIVKKIIIFDENYKNIIKKNYSNALFLICLNRIETFINELFLKSKVNKISGIILTGTFKYTKNVLNLIDYLKNSNIPIFFVNKNTIMTLSQLEKFNFNINFYNKTYINKILKYISSYFNNINLFLFQNKKINYKRKYSPKEFCYRLKKLSQKNIKRIILPEAYEPRILQAASISDSLGIAECILLGNPKKIYEIAHDKGIHLSKNIKIIQPNLIRNNYISRLLELRKNKGMTEFSAIKQLQDNTILATLILESNEVDGLVSGSINTTANTIRPALQIIKTNSIYSLVSSIFFMLFPQEVLIYGDCAINVDPTAEELAEIAIQSANSAKNFGIEPRIAMLSYSSGYSGNGLQVEKVRNATSIVKLKQPNLIIEGPIQYDAAISKKVSKLKTPSSLIEGSANIFIFPDLNSGNITYKAIQRSLGLICIGPMLQGLRKPVNDLSRGASIEDIIYTIALTSIQS
ncbi:phosphate acetyltransferase [Buchnera aphidicola (Aphis helianthi)]|uniref:Phosphate acetyltransferase n=1 Tax=Buchnera aphidicola (Aphis helianthi) TaxID=2315802 RepID=A0A4D6XQ23_9GAMM|nr:phosphate acetyltransferase [Buchnera aphidicola]QCI17008.1 phosphate acetyltransferase [Buchnera aphidicola (Aphis helianthi)]